jgi:hypothetical protein
LGVGYRPSGSPRIAIGCFAERPLLKRGGGSCSGECTYVRRTEEVSFWPCQHSLSVVPENPPGLQNLDPRFRAILGCGCHQPRSLSWRSCQARAQKATPPPPPHLRKQLQPQPHETTPTTAIRLTVTAAKKKRERERERDRRASLLPPSPLHTPQRCGSSSSLRPPF